ncbi:MAG: N-acetylmuramic acid 6-phosphate etherase [Firmicutes bacterium]|nr:N-acetylmuramic acid 6-phosphate etherase [Bacillota bacterium]
MNKIKLDSLVTETRNTASMNIDELPIGEVINLICEEDQKAVQAVHAEADQMVKAVELMIDSLKKGGRVFYMGSGTSGRLGVLDAAELLPTFGVGEDVFKAKIAGGEIAMFHPVEAAEDNYQAGVSDLMAENPSPLDVVIGISASGRTPYVMGALEKATEVGMRKIGLTCNRETPMHQVADIVIAPVVGPEVITGSTRMKAGTAQKLVLNILSTVTMIRLGKVYQNLMVDMQPTNEKLRRRAERIVMDATGMNLQRAQEALEQSQGNIKASIVMLKANCDFPQAMQLLVDSEGFVTEAIKLAGKQ